jgi:hypothetical protein
MKNWLIMMLALAATALVVPLNCMAQGSNLVYNGGFEGPADNGQPKDWLVNISRGTEAEVSLDSVEKHSGSNSLKILVKPPGGRVIVYLDETGAAPVSPGATYEASCWIKTRSLDYNPFREAPAFRLNFGPQRLRPGKIADLINLIGKTSDWTKITMATAVPQGSNRLHLDFIFTNGTAWIDDIAVRKVE